MSLTYYGSKSSHLLFKDWTSIIFLKHLAQVKIKTCMYCYEVKIEENKKSAVTRQLKLGALGFRSPATISFSIFTS